MDQTDEALEAVRLGATAGDLETQHLDFKEPAEDVKSTLKILADAAVCFANATGGDIVVGIKDKESGPKAFVGIPPSLSVDLVRKGIFDRTRPSLTCFVEAREVGHGASVLVVKVPQGVGTHANASGTATRRLGRECLPFTPDQQREVLAARGQVDFSAEFTSASTSDLLGSEIERMRRLLRRAGKDSLAGAADDHLLTDLRLITSTGRVTNAALLLLGSEEALARHLPSYGCSYQFRPSAGSEALARTRERRPLLAAVEVMIDAISARVETHPLNLAGGVQLRLSNYPLDAVRELVVNGLIHRSYETNGSVDVEHAPEHLSISSPGGLVAGVTPSNILTYPSTPRNRLLTETVATLQLAERTGQGIDRAYREMLRSGKEPPEFEDLGTLVRVTMPGGAGNDSFVRFVASLPDQLSGDVDVLLAFSHLRSTRSIDAIRLSVLIQRTVVQSQKVLSQLEAGAFIEASRRTASRQHPTYRLRSETLAAKSGRAHV